MRSTPSSTKRVRRGSAANSEVSASELPTEARSGLYIGQPSGDGTADDVGDGPGRSGPVEQVRGTGAPQGRVQGLHRVRGRDRRAGPAQGIGDLQQAARVRRDQQLGAGGDDV